MNYEVFKKAMGALAVALPNVNIEFSVFWNFLQDLTEEELLNAVSDIISTQKEIYPGTNVLALIREKAKSKKHVSAGEAWGLVRSEIRSEGYMSHPKIDDPLIQKAVDIIGWDTLCASENISIERAHFLKAYATLIERENYDLALGPQKQLTERKKKVNIRLNN